MRKGFTMIELIFVIVILGILAAVAVPKLSATRTDAQVTAAAADISTLYKDLGAYYTAQGQWGDANGTLSAAGLKKMTNVGSAYVSGSNIVFNTDSNVTCITLALTTDGNVSKTGTDGTGTVCTAVRALSSVSSLISNTQAFGGTRVQR